MSHAISHQLKHGNKAALILKFQSQALNHLHIAAVAVEKDKFSCTVPIQAQENLTAELVEDFVVNVNGSGIGSQTLASTIGNGRSNQNVALLLNHLQ